MHSVWLDAAFLVVGLAALAWSSDFFVAGAAALAKALRISPFIVGMVVIGFGTSAPELCVSVLSGISGHANLSIGNAYGSCSFNIAVIIGVAALISPVVVKPSAAFVAGPGLAAVALFSAWLFRDGACSRPDAVVMLVLFAVLLPLYCWFDRKSGAPAADAPQSAMGGVGAAVVKTVVGLAVLVGSSYVLVEGAVGVARFFGVSDLLIGLTVVAVGTSLPELASAVASARRGEHEFVIGNIVGSNLFNTLAVVGLACVISPAVPGTGADGSAVPAFSRYILTRDLPMMAVFSLAITVLGANWRNLRAPGSIGRAKAAFLLVAFAAYAFLMFVQETGG